MPYKLIVLALFLFVVGPVRAQPGVGLTADPIIPIPNYHPRGDFGTNIDKLVAVRPVVIAASKQLGVLPTAMMLIPFADALYPRESYGALARMVYYEKLFEGRIRSLMVKKGMTFEEAVPILGRMDGAIVCGLGGSTYIYHSLGVVVNWPMSFGTNQASGADRVSWHFRWYTPVFKPSR